MKSWKTPTPEQVTKAVALLGHAEQYRYFFDRLENPQWIEPLKTKGFFGSPPQAIPWPASRYLARMAARAPETVLEVALQIPSTDNVRVHEDLVDAALEIPANLAAKLVPKAKKWIELPYQLLLPEKLGALVEHLTKGGQIEAALDLAKSLLAVLPDPRATDKTSGEEAYPLSREPRARFDAWYYKEILEKNLDRKSVV